MLCSGSPKEVERDTGTCSIILQEGTAKGEL